MSTIEVTSGWLGSRLEIVPVRMACGCLCDRKMRPEDRLEGRATKPSSEVEQLGVALSGSPEKWHSIPGSYDHRFSAREAIEQLNLSFSEVRTTAKFEYREERAGVNGKSDPGFRYYGRYTCGVAPEEF